MDLRDTKRPKTVQTAEELFEIGIQKAQSADVYRKRTQSAIKWYLGLIRQFAPAKMSRASFRKRDRLKSSVKMGSMFCYIYDAKTKDELPYWDKFPLVFPVSPNKKGNGWYGLNLHYVPLQYRARLLYTLYRLMNNKRYDESTKLKLSYQILTEFGTLDRALAMVAFKEYLTDRVRSRFIYISPDEWPIAMYLPTEQWQKKGFSDVYRDIETQIKELRNK